MRIAAGIVGILVGIASLFYIGLFGDMLVEVVKRGQVLQSYIQFAGPSDVQF